MKETNFHDAIKKNFDDMLDVLYNDIKELLQKNNGYINTSNTKGKDVIYSVEFTSNEIAEWQVLGLRLVNNEVEYCADYDGYEVSDEELKDMEWYHLKCTDNYYIQTLYNIWESLYEYV